MPLVTFFSSHPSSPGKFTVTLVLDACREVNACVLVTYTGSFVCSDAVLTRHHLLVSVVDENAQIYHAWTKLGKKRQLSSGMRYALMDPGNVWTKTIWC